MSRPRYDTEIDTPENRDRLSKQLYWLLPYEKKQQRDDLVQETFFLALNGQENFEGRAKPSTWLLRIGLNLIAGIIRREKRPKHYNQSISLQDVNPDELTSENYRYDPYKSLLDKELREERLEAQSQLYGKDAEIFELFLIHGMSHKEVAAILGITEKTSKSNFRRAKLELVQELSKRGVTP